MLDRRGESRVGYAREGTGGVELGIGEVMHAWDECAAAGVGAALLEVSPGGVEGAELDRYAGTDAEEGREGAFVEGEGAFVLVDGSCGGQGGGVGG